MKEFRRATLTLIVLGNIFLVTAVATVITMSVWANKPRGIRIHLDEE